VINEKISYSTSSREIFSNLSLTVYTIQKSVSHDSLHPAIMHHVTIFFIPKVSAWIKAFDNFQIGTIQHVIYSSLKF